MPLREEIERDGNWLFRYRSYLPLLLALVIVIAMFSNDYRPVDRSGGTSWDIACLLVSFLGLAVRIYTIGHTPAGTSGRNTREQVADTLNSSGIYSTVRHPLYLGNFLIWLGISMYDRLWWVVLITVLVFWIYYERIMFAEEEFLRRSFPDDYERWAAGTPAFIPDPTKWKKPSLPFSFRNVLKREYSGFFAIICSFTFLDIVSGVITQRRFAPEPFYRILFAVGLVVYLVLRTLKKKSSLLSVDGR